MSSNHVSSLAKSTANNAILTETNLSHHNSRMNQQKPMSFTTLSDNSSDSSSDRSVTPPPEFTYTRRTLTSLTTRQTPSPVRTTSLPSLPTTPTQRRRTVLTRPALMLEGTPVRPQRPGSVSSGSFSFNREPTPSLRNTLTRLDEPSPQTPREVARKEEDPNQLKKDDFKATPEPPRIRDDKRKLTSLSELSVEHSPVKRPIAEDIGPKKVQRSESSSSAKIQQSQTGLPCKIIKVNGREYYQLNKIQVGGSGTVYKVLSMEQQEIFALKEVNVGSLSETNFQACMNEVELLQELQGNECVVKLLDYEMDKDGSKLKLLFEFGEIDVDRYMHSNRLDIHDIRHFWRKMVEAVHLLHERRIVHSDLKPANFMIVRGRVKIIDFGIAKAINMGTQNIHRDTISGTSNYLSPEAVRDVGLVDGSVSEDSHEQGSAYPLYKVGKPADIWALGIILYCMVYGSTPFSRFKDLETKAIAIVRRKVDYPRLTKGQEHTTTELLSALKWCLQKDASKRPTAQQLLGHGFLSL